MGEIALTTKAIIITLRGLPFPPISLSRKGAVHLLSFLLYTLTGATKENGSSLKTLDAILIVTLSPIKSS